MDKCIVKNEEYIPALLELTESGLEVPLTVSGNSMSPFLIHERDSVVIQKIQSPPQKGDILLFIRRDGRYILHRLVRIEGERYFFLGDAQ